MLQVTRDSAFQRYAKKPTPPNFHITIPPHPRPKLFHMFEPPVPVYQFHLTLLTYSPQRGNIITGTDTHDVNQVLTNSAVGVCVF